MDNNKNGALLLVSRAQWRKRHKIGMQKYILRIKELCINKMEKEKERKYIV
jgi:hypothetical protein